MYFINFCGGGVWAGILGVSTEIGRNEALNISIGKIWKIERLEWGNVRIIIMIDMLVESPYNEIER